MRHWREARLQRPWWTSQVVWLRRTNSARHRRASLRSCRRLASDSRWWAAQLPYVKSCKYETSLAHNFSWTPMSCNWNVLLPIERSSLGRNSFWRISWGHFSGACRRDVTTSGSDSNNYRSKHNVHMSVWVKVNVPVKKGTRRMSGRDLFSLLLPCLHNMTDFFLKSLPSSRSVC